MQKCNVEKLEKLLKLRWRFILIPIVTLVLFVGISFAIGGIKNEIIVTIMVTVLMGASGISGISILVLSYWLLISTGSSKLSALVMIIFSIIPLVLIVVISLTESRAAEIIKNSHGK